MNETLVRKIISVTMLPESLQAAAVWAVEAEAKSREAMAIKSGAARLCRGLTGMTFTPHGPHAVPSMMSGSDLSELITRIFGQPPPDPRLL